MVDGLTQFLEQVKKECPRKVLTKKMELKLGRIIQDPKTLTKHKREAIHKLVLHNVYLVVKLSHKYKRYEFEFEDIVEYGILGLFSAAEKYDPNQDVRFSSYARHWIKESIMKAIRGYSGLPKIPAYLSKNLWAVTRLLASSDKYTNEQLAQIAGITEEDAEYLRSLIFKAVEFDPSMSPVMPTTPEADYSKTEFNDILLSQMKKLLTEDQFSVVAHVMGLDGYIKMSLSEIEENLKIENPKRVKSDAFNKLRTSKLIQNLYEDIKSNDI